MDRQDILNDTDRMRRFYEYIEKYYPLVLRAFNGSRYW